MNWRRLEGNWGELRGKAKERWGQLTDEDLRRIQGKRDQLEGAVMDRYALAPDEAQRQVRDFARDCGC